MAGAPDPDAARSEAEEILDRPEFSDPEPGLVDRLLTWIGDRIGALFDGLTAGDVGSIVLLVVVAALLGLLLWVAARRRRLRLPAEPTHTTERLEGHGSAPDVERWRHAAAEARSRGEWAEAIRCEHRATAARLDQLALLRERPHRTTGELVGDLAGRPDVADAMGDLTSAFEEVWYGERPADQQLSDAMSHVADEVVDAAERT